MKCLSEEQLVAYLRGTGDDPRLIESHALQCPGCAYQLLLARESLAELVSKSIQPGTDRLLAIRPQATRTSRGPSWIPWSAAAALLVAVLLFAVLSPKAPLPSPAPAVGRPPSNLPPRSSQVTASVPKVDLIPEPKTRIPIPEAPASGAQPEPKVVLPPPPPTAPRSDLPAPAPRKEPAEPPAAPRPAPEPKRPAPTLVEKAVVARVIHSVGLTPSAAGRVLRSGDLLTTVRSEFLEVAIENYGQVYFRENSQVEFGASGDIFLHEGEMLARVDPEQPLGQIKTPIAVLEPQTRLFNVVAGKTSTEVSFLSGNFIIGSSKAAGPTTMIAKSGKPPEIRSLEPGFASWIPDKLAAKRFTGFYEGEEFPMLQGFKAMPYEQSSGGQAAVQSSDQAALAFKTALPFKARYAVWVRVRQFEGKAAVMGIRLNGQSALDAKLDFAETRSSWRWVGPVMASGDRLDFAVQALSRWPLKEGEPARSFPVVVDVVMVTSDLKSTPPEKPGDASGRLNFVVEAAQK